MSADHLRAISEAAERRLRAGQELSAALETMNAAVRDAREAGVSAIQIAEAIGTTRQRVYEILREA